MSQKNMSQQDNSDNRVSGRYLIQELDHQVGVSQAQTTQTTQSHSPGKQHGSADKQAKTATNKSHRQAQ